MKVHSELCTEVTILRKGMGPILTGLATGAAIGTAAYMMSNKSRHGRTGKIIRRNTGKALKTVGSVIENVSYMMR